MHEKSKIVVTGFEPFHCHPVNSSKEVSKSLKLSQTEHERVCNVLEVTYEAADKFAANLVRQNDIGCVLMMGLRDKSHRINLERIAVNVEHSAIPDEAGEIRNECCIEPDGPDGIFSTLPVQRLQEKLTREEYPVKISNSAGTFVCNSVFYRVMYALKYRVKKDIPAGFIHLPPVSAMWSLDRLVSAMETIIADLEKGMGSYELN